MLGVDQCSNQPMGQTVLAGPTEKKHSESNRASPAGYDMSRSLPGKAVVNLSDHFRVAESQTFHLRRGGDRGL